MSHCTGNHVKRPYSAPVFLMAILVLLANACRHAGSSNAPRPTLEIEHLTTLSAAQTARDSLARLLHSEGDAAAHLICVDSVGRRNASDSVCRPCLPYGIRGSASASIAHARALWTLLGKSPYDVEDEGALCMLQAYDLALAASHDDRDIRVEKALMLTMFAGERERQNALLVIDVLLDSLVAGGDRLGAAKVLASVGTTMLDRAERMDARALDIDLDEREVQVHQIIGDRPLLFKQLPAPLRASKQLGESEALWAATLLERAAQAARDNPAIYARYERLSLAPFVLLERWAQLDSVSATLMSSNPRDSIAPVARALARFHLVQNAVRDYPAVMALFDTALHRMRPSDSLSYDAFDYVLTKDDDEWRSNFEWNDRVHLDTRGWAVLDPLWLTPVNEVLLTRRARVAEANFRYSHLAAAGESGSETAPGIMFIKRGAPKRRWTTKAERVAVIPPVGGEKRKFDAVNQHMFRDWPDLFTVITVKNDASTPQLARQGERETWRVFYSDYFGLTQQATRSGTVRQCPGASTRSDLLSCALASNSYYKQVPLYMKLDTIDVALARFRGRDSVEMLMSARVPLRKFVPASDVQARTTDSITLAAWVETDRGDVLFRHLIALPIPNDNAIARRSQWEITVPATRVMHRVEALEPRFITGARGSHRVTSADDSFFELEGFGMSDIIVADSIAARGELRSWHDLRIVGNGGVTAPKQRVALAWETYNLQAGPDGLARWRVTIRREDGTAIANTDMRGLMISDASAMDKIVSVDSNPSTISYVRASRPAARMVEYLSVPGDVAVGRHLLVVTVQDLVTNARTERAVGLRVLDPNAQARVRCITSGNRCIDQRMITGPGYATPIPPPQIRPPDRR